MRELKQEREGSFFLYTIVMRNDKEIPLSFGTDSEPLIEAATERGVPVHNNFGDFKNGKTVTRVE